MIKARSVNSLRAFSMGGKVNSDLAVCFELPKAPVILSKRSASKDLRTKKLPSTAESAKIPRLHFVSLGMTHLGVQCKLTAKSEFDYRRNVTERYPGGISNIDQLGTHWQAALPPDKSEFARRRNDTEQNRMGNDNFRTVHVLSAGTARYFGMVMVSTIWLSVSLRSETAGIPDS